MRRDDYKIGGDTENEGNVIKPQRFPGERWWCRSMACFLVTAGYALPEPLQVNHVEKCRPQKSEALPVKYMFKLSVVCG